MSEMTREEAIEVIEQDIPCEYDRDLIEALHMAISALSADGEYIKKEGAIECLNDLFGEMCHVSFGDVLQSIDSLQTYSFPDSAEIENTTVYVLKAILKHGHCYCDSENLSAYKAIKNAIAIITSLERLKAEIKDIDPITIIGAEIKQEILDIIDKYIGDKAE